MKLIVIMMIFSYSLAEASVNIRQLNLSYRAPSGQGSVQVAQYEGRTLRGDFTIERVAQETYFQFLSETIQLPFIESFLDGAREAKLDDGHFVVNAQRSFVEMERLLLRYSDRRDNFERLKLDCRGANELDLIKILEKCIEKGSVDLGVADLGAPSTALSIVRSTALATGQMQVAQHSTAATISNLELNLDRGRLKGETRIRTGVNLKIKFDGRVTLDANRRLLRIKVDRVRTGFINITKRFFRELRKVEIDGLEVRRPYLEISL